MTNIHKNDETYRNAAEDLALIRTMMETGRRRAGIDGGHLIVWGALLAAAFLAQYAQVYGYIPGSMLVIWVPVAVIGWCLSFMIGRREYAQTKASSGIAVTGYSAAWSATGITMISYFAPAVAFDQFDPHIITLLTGAVFGTAFYVIGRITALKSLLIAAAGWWAIMIYTIWIDRYPAHMLLILSIACILLVFLPGLSMRRFRITAADDEQDQNA